MNEFVPFMLIMLLITVVFYSIALYALKRKTPMHFWSGTKVRPEEIRDIKAYNKANAIMWFVYGTLYALSIILAYFFERLGIIFIVFLSLPGIIILILVYRKIYNYYSVKNVNSKY